MMEWLKTLWLPLRFVVYVAGTLLLFALAVGFGAAAAFVVGGQFGAAPTGSVEVSTSGGKSKTTGATTRAKNTAMEPSGDSASPTGTTYEASFVHQATDENSRGDYTYVSDPSIDGDTNAVVLVSPVHDREGTEAAAYGHNIGVWYEGVARKWAVFNQDRAGISAGASFEVIVPQEADGFVHYADLLNTVGHYTYVDNRLTNGQPDAVLSVTQNWNPGGGRGVYNDHPVSIRYDARVDKWAIYNQDGATMTQGAAFNIGVSADANDTAP